MTKILNFGLKIKGVVGRVAHAKSSDPATPQKFGTCTGTIVLQSRDMTSYLRCTHENRPKIGRKFKAAPSPPTEFCTRKVKKYSK